MRVRYSFSSRKTGHIENIGKQREKYPSIAIKIIDLSDIILEILDARFISKTRNLEIEKEIELKSKKIIYVLNKFDLVKKLEKENINLYPYVVVSCKLRRGIKNLRNKIKIEAKKIFKDKVTVGVLGYPNTGKSSLINILIGKKSAPTSREAGFTKGLQKIKLSENIVLLDSPGVIPKKEYLNIVQKQVSKNAIVGARSYSQVKDPDFIVADLMKEFAGVLENYYNIQANADSEILIEELGRKKKLLKKGNQVDVDKTSRLILKAWQEGKIKV